MLLLSSLRRFIPVPNWAPKRPFRAPLVNLRFLDPQISGNFSTPVYSRMASSSAMASKHDKARPHRAFIALGSNMGDRIAWIEKACNAMESTPDIKIIRTSSLWETSAMYVLDQDKFANGACEIRTSLEPVQLLDRLQSIENELGRVKVIDKGPRNIDLDILLYNEDVITHERLLIPHKLMLERDFVLRPLCELNPSATLPGLSSQTTSSEDSSRTVLSEHSSQPTISEYLSRLPSPVDPLSTLTPLASGMLPMTSLHSNRHTQIMSILNLTPDSFSDGDLHDRSSTAYLQQAARKHIAAGATILDIGGQSTRPKADLIPPDEELKRILPAISAIRSLPESATAIISVDTFHSSVAEAAIEAGAHMINDVSAGTLDPKMLATVARLGCTVCLMHMRGTPATMSSLTDYPDGVVETVARELLGRVRAAEEAGIRRWRIVLDPGLGFAKNLEQNLELLRRLQDLREFEGLKGLPWLVGASRKGFVGRVTGVKEAKDRTWGTAAAVSAAVQGGADIVRVHDVEEMGKVVKMADAVWRF